jgi:hypothetical protein
MTKRDLFIIILKIIGLRLLLTFFTAVLPFIVQIGYATWETRMVLTLAFEIVIYVAFALVLLFKSSAILRIFKLDKGFEDDRIDLGQLGVKDLFKVASIVVGGLLIVEQVSLFLTYSYKAFHMSQIGWDEDSDNSINWILCGINLVIGFLLITQYEFIAKKLMPNREDERAKE